MPLYRTWEVIHVNRFLSLSLSRHYPSVTSALVPHSFPFVMCSGPTLSSSFYHLLCPLCSAPPFVRLVAGDGQRMARLWDKDCPAESTGLLRVVEDVQDARLRWGEVGSVVSVVTRGRSIAAASASGLAFSFM